MIPPAMAELATFPPLLLLLLPLIFFLLTSKLFFFSRTELTQSNPIIISPFSLPSKLQDRIPWLAKQLQSSPTSTVVVKMPLNGGDRIVTANPDNVEHVLKTKFQVYQKGEKLIGALRELLGNGILNVDGEEWKVQRRIARHEFSTNSLRKFVEQVVDSEIEHRLVPILAQLAGSGEAIDFQSLLRRFTFDNICQIAFGYDPELLLPSLPESPFAAAFEEAVAISSLRFRAFSPIVWKLKRFFNVGSEKRLKIAASQIREIAAEIVRRKKANRNRNRSIGSDSDLDLLSRFIESGHSDEQFVIDNAINFILAGRDTTSAGLTWFFWLLSKNPSAEREIVEEIARTFWNPRGSAYDESKDLVYLHAALHESMRIFPPVAVDSKRAAADDVLPDGTAVKKGDTVTYHVYAMGRMERIWGEDWPEFRPERWLEEREDGGGGKKRGFLAKDLFAFPVFQAGPRVCLGKEMAVLQMKRVATEILRRFTVVPAVERFEPVYMPYLATEMEGGFPVRFEKRV